MIILKIIIFENQCFEDNILRIFIYTNNYFENNYPEDDLSNWLFGQRSFLGNHFGKQSF